MKSAGYSLYRWNSCKLCDTVTCNPSEPIHSLVRNNSIFSQAMELEGEKIVGRYLRKMETYGLISDRIDLQWNAELMTHL